MIDVLNCDLFQLFLMKRGGEEIYVGPLGHHSSQLVQYFEVVHIQNYFLIFVKPLINGF